MQANPVASTRVALLLPNIRLTPHPSVSRASAGPLRSTLPHNTRRGEITSQKVKTLAAAMRSRCCLKPSSSSARGVIPVSPCSGEADLSQPYPQERSTIANNYASHGAPPPSALPPPPNKNQTCTTGLRQGNLLLTPFPPSSVPSVVAFFPPFHSTTPAHPSFLPPRSLPSP